MMIEYFPTFRLFSKCWAFSHGQKVRTFGDKVYKKRPFNPRRRMTFKYDRKFLFTLIRIRFSLRVEFTLLVQPDEQSNETKK